MQLVIAEKPSVAMALSKVLGAKSRGDGYMEGGGWLVSWCIGHLVELAPADAYDPAIPNGTITTCPFCRSRGNSRCCRTPKSSLKP